MTAKESKVVAWLYRYPHDGEPDARIFAWFTDDFATDKSATTYDPVVAGRWIAKGWPVTTLVLESLLAEAESRIVNLENSVAAMRRTRDEMQSNLIALQSRLELVQAKLDAVVGLADRLGMALLTDDFDEKKRIYTELRSAALGCATTGEGG